MTRLESIKDFDSWCSAAIQLACSNSRVYQHFIWADTRLLTIIAVGRVCLPDYISLLAPVIILEGFVKSKRNWLRTACRLYNQQYRVSNQTFKNKYGFEITK